MPKTINPIRKAKVKQALKQGKSARQALKEANYAPETIKRSTANKSVKVSMDELKQEFSESDITIKLVINNLIEDRKWARKKGDFSTVVRVDELLGKYLAMFTDKAEVKDTTESKDVQARLRMYDN